MGTWALEHDPGRTGNVYKMFHFNEDVFGICYGGTGGGVWRRTPPTWTRTTGDRRACIWNGLMWVDSGMQILRSEDGVNWVTDWNPWFSPWDYWSALNGYGDYLRCGSRASGAPLGNHFYRRDKDGNWTETPIGQADNNSFYDIINYGDYVYLSAAVADVYRWTGAAWEDEPTLDTYVCYFTPIGNIMYATATTKVYRDIRSGWALDFDSGLDPVSNTFGAISEGGDGNLWVAAEGATDSEIYFKSGGIWMHHSTVAGAEIKSVIADGDGNLFAGSRSCEFWRYTPSFDVTPAGGGLYPQALDCDADGDSLYVCCYDAATGQPVLIRVALPLAADSVGAAIFTPGDGDAINIKCSNVGGRLAISGNFAAAGNEQVETSEDAGLNWVDIDRDAWGAETAQPLLVGDDIVQVMVALQTAQDITETENAGATPWAVNNPAVGYSPIAAARLPQGDEMILSGSGIGIDYSPNRGAELHDTDGPTDAVALEVV